MGGHNPTGIKLRTTEVEWLAHYCTAWEKARTQISWLLIHCFSPITPCRIKIQNFLAGFLIAQLVSIKILGYPHKSRTSDIVLIHKRQTFYDQKNKITPWFLKNRIRIYCWIHILGRAQFPKDGVGVNLNIRGLTWGSKDSVDGDTWISCSPSGYVPKCSMLAHVNSYINMNFLWDRQPWLSLDSQIFHLKILGIPNLI